MNSVGAGALENINKMVADLRQVTESRITYSRRFRMDQLKGIKHLLNDNRADLIDALASDLGKPPFEAVVSELGIVKSEAEHAYLYVTDWMESTSVRMPLTWQPATGHVRLRPRGMALIIGPWSFPVRMVLSPLISAVAAGNTAFLGTSPLAPASSTLLEELIPEYLDASAIKLVPAPEEVLNTLLENEWDHILFSGGPERGKQVARAAAEYLTPTVLLLAGKSPCVVSDGRAWSTIARRVAWAKWLNAGQSLVSPDYVLALGEQAEKNLEDFLPTVIREFYGKNPQVSQDYGRLISAEHTQRLANMLDGSVAAGARVVSGGEYDIEEKYMAPTVVSRVTEEMPLMQKEIYGPILPIISVSNIDEATAFINRRPSPPAAYLFTDRARVRREFEERVVAGGIGFDVAMLQSMVPTLPLGGVGDSGMGRIHGHAGFLTYSQQRSELGKTDQVDTLKALYPPYTWAKKQVGQRMF